MINTNPLEFAFITHPWCYKNDLFSTAELNEIIKYSNTLKKQKSTIIVDANKSKVNENFRISNTSWITRNEHSYWFFDKLAMEINNLNETYYGFDLHGYSKIQFSEYESKNLGKYDYHMDMFLGTYSSEEPLTRKLSATLLLNNDFKGGEFQFYDSKKQPEMTAGSLIVFPSFLIHKVNQVIEGTRYSLVAWALGPKFR